MSGHYNKATSILQDVQGVLFRSIIFRKEDLEAWNAAMDRADYFVRNGADMTCEFFG